MTIHKDIEEFIQNKIISFEMEYCHKYLMFHTNKYMYYKYYIIHQNMKV